MSIIREATSAIECLKSINDQDDNETLMPVGLGTFVNTKITPNKKLILNIGAGVAVEKDKNSAINFLESRLKEMQIALQETAGQKQQVSESLQQAKLEMEKLMTAHNQK
jgi:prefoldin alpha subunit